MGNLYYDETRKIYAFTHFYSNFYLENSVARVKLSWKWKALRPGANGVANTCDPCSKVYPTGFWKLPTLADFESIHLYPKVPQIQQLQLLLYEHNIQVTLLGILKLGLV